MYQGEDKINLPPVLTSEGARVNPEWLKRFLANPSLSTTDTNRDGVRSYLQVRMPTFSFSDDEIRSLVLFFERHFASGPAVHSAEARAAHDCRSRHGARSSLPARPRLA